MKIFGSTVLYPPFSRIGSLLATHQFMRALAARGHQVELMPWMQPKQEPHDFDGVRIVPRSREIVEHVKGADVVISHLGDNGLVHKLAREHAVPSVRLIHSPQPGARRGMAGAALLVANSVATAEASGAPNALVCPPPTWPAQHNARPGGAATLVNLSKAKGAELFWALAHSMPDVKFVGVTGAYGKQMVEELPNVTVLPLQDDMRAVWSATRVLLMPSEYEAWGMTGVEAMCSGIPVVAHPTPGLRESLGRAGIFIDRGNFEEWARMVRRLLEQQGAWNAASRLARQRVDELDPQASVDRFCNAIERL